MDGWESARFISIFLASDFFYISNRIHARPTATTPPKACGAYANREPLTTLFHFLSTQSCFARLSSHKSPSSRRTAAHTTPGIVVYHKYEANLILNIRINAAVLGRELTGECLHDETRSLLQRIPATGLLRQNERFSHSQYDWHSA